MWWAQDEDEDEDGLKIKNLMLSLSKHETGSDTATSPIQRRNPAPRSPYLMGLVLPP